MSSPFDECEGTTENRGVPGSSPGLATPQTSMPSWFSSSGAVRRRSRPRFPVGTLDITALVADPVIRDLLTGVAVGRVREPAVAVA